jgi:hypothetical protein
VSALVLAAWLLAAPPEAAAPPRAPRIAVEPSSFDFGGLRPGHRVHRAFVVKNFGTADLQITNVSTTCGCTAALLDRQTLRPGRSATLRVTFDTRDDRGRVSRSVLIESNDPVRPKLELKLEATVMEPSGNERQR